MKRHGWTQKRLKTWPCLVAPIHIFSFSFPGSWALEEWEQQAGAGPFHYTLTNCPGRLDRKTAPYPPGTPRKGPIPCLIPSRRTKNP